MDLTTIPREYELLEAQIELLQDRQEEMDTTIKCLQTYLLSTHVTNKRQLREQITQTQSVMIEQLIRTRGQMDEQQLRDSLIQLAKC